MGIENVRAFDSPSQGAEVDRGPSIEELGMSFSEITGQIEELLERREHIRKQLDQKLNMARDMADAITAKFNERTGLDRLIARDTVSEHDWRNKVG